MAMRAGAVYDALLAANVPQDKAIAASEEVVSQDTRLNRLSTDMAVLKWMVGTLIVIQIGGFSAFFAFAIHHLSIR